MRRAVYAGDKPGASAGLPSYCIVYPAGGPYTFTAPRNGRYLFAAHGAGAEAAGTTAGGTTGASGGYCEKTLWLNAAATVSVTVGKSGDGVDTTVGAPFSLTASRGSGTTAGTGTGGDTNINGTAGVANGNTPGAGSGAGGGASGGPDGGAGAPGTLQFPGGTGGDTNAGTRFHQDGTCPGAGGALNANSSQYGLGGDGRVVVYLVE